MEYNLLEETWIPVLYLDGRFERVGIRKPSAEARRILVMAMSIALGEQSQVWEENEDVTQQTHNLGARQLQYLRRDGTMPPALPHECGGEPIARWLRADSETQSPHAGGVKSAYGGSEDALCIPSITKWPRLPGAWRYM